jgi:pimeloyl-ACP methyl ester carboxylesterase
MTPIEPNVLPDGIRSRFVSDVNGLNMHVLEAGSLDRPLLLLLHGFPELAYSWRKVMLPLAEAGYRVVAPDQRGYGRTADGATEYDVDLEPYGMLNLTRDALALVRALGYEAVAAVVGHDFGASVAAYCALIRPDVFRKVAIMSAPFSGPPVFPYNTDGDSAAVLGNVVRGDIDAELALLSRPRKHYHSYYSTRSANADMQHCAQGMADLLRGYFHGKSADWPGNDPHRLTAWAADSLAEMPTYYIMDRDATMAETAATFLPTAEEIATCEWLPDDELAFYAAEYSRTGFQGGLNWYRGRLDAALTAGLRLFSGRTIDVPSIFISGEKDWGVYQSPGAVEAMQERVCPRMSGVHLLPGAGHWVQQEQPAAVVEHITQLLAS